jgi:putative Ca2+/H+ antiporter (TMEM165/GDT1 family)
MLTAALVSLSVVFVAELGDKSQLMTMTYALRHRWWVVLSGVGIASFMVHGLSVTIGHFLGLTLPERPIAFAAAIAFLLFAVWTWREGRARDDELVKVAQPRHVLLAVISSFVLAELGDKTMLATVALASDRNWAGVWIGATAGMLLADGVPSRWAQCCTSGYPRTSCTAWPACCFCCSVCGCCSTVHSAFGGSRSQSPEWLPWQARPLPRLPSSAIGASTRSRSRRSNRRPSRANARLATVGRTTDQAFAVVSLSRATCRGRDRRASTPPTCLRN